MQCQEIMRRPVEFVKSGETIAVAARKMRDANIGFVPVCDSSGKVRGVLTDRDLAVRALAEERSPGRTSVDEVMTREVVFCRPDDDLIEAEHKMGHYKKSRILIIADNQRPIGVISLSDLAVHRDARAYDTLRDVASREVVSDSGKTASSKRL